MKVRSIMMVVIMSATEETMGGQPQVRNEGCQKKERKKVRKKKKKTEKGREHQITHHIKRLSYARLGWRKVLLEILPSLDSVVNLDQLKVYKEFKKFNDVLNAFY